MSHQMQDPADYPNQTRTPQKIAEAIALLKPLAGYNDPKYLKDKPLDSEFSVKGGDVSQYGITQHNKDGLIVQTFPITPNRDPFYHLV